MLHCDGLSCIRGGRPLFAGLGFCLAPGALLLLKGANGSGKTTLLKLVAGLAQPESGDVQWEGKPVAGNAGFLRDLTYIGHKDAIKTEATVVENIRFFARNAGTEMLVPAALHYFDLADKADVPCWQLSAGWQRKVALSRLIVAPTRLWLLDEPSNYLDEESVALVGALIESRVKQDGIVIAATHSLRSPYASHTLQLEDFSPC